MSAGRPSQAASTAVTPSREMAPFLGGVARAVAATMLWSSSAILVDRLTVLYHLTPFQIATWRELLVLVILTGIIAIRRPAAFTPDSRSLPYYAISGVIGITVSMVAWAGSVRLNGPTAATAIAFGSPAFVAIGDRLFFGTMLTPLQIGAVVTNLVGCGLASGVRSPGALVHSPVGLLVGLANGLAFATYSLIGRATARTGPRDPLTALLYTFLFATVGVLIWGLAAQGIGLLAPRLDAIGWLLLAGLAVGPTLISYALYNSSLKVLPATVAGLVTTLEPPMVAVLAAILLGKSVLARQWLGIALIVIGVVVMQLQMRRLVEQRPTGQSPR